jgi:hypothetical protein
MGDDGHGRGRFAALVLGGPRVAGGPHSQEGTRRVPASVSECPAGRVSGRVFGAREAGKLAELFLEELLHVLLGRKLDLWQVCNLTQKLAKVILTFTLTLTPEGVTPVVIFHRSNFAA